MSAEAKGSYSEGWPRVRGTKDGQDFWLVTLLALDKTHHGLASGSIPDMEAIGGSVPLRTLEEAGLVRRSPKFGTLELTDAGRDEARSVAGELARSPS